MMISSRLNGRLAAGLATAALAGAVLAGMTLAGATLAGCGEGMNGPVSNESNRLEVAGGGKPDRVLSCQTFAGFSHCTIGGTTLSLGTALTVAGFGGAGSDGVASSTGTVHGWSQTGTIDFPNGGGGSIAYTATSGGVVLGGATIAQGTPASSLSVGPNFPGAGSYSIKVYSNGVQQASQDDIGGDGEPCRIVIDENIGGFTYEDVEAGIIVIDDTSIRFDVESGAGSMTVVLPNGTVATGNKVVFEAPLPPGGATTFDNVNVAGFLDSYTITTESVTP